MRNSNGHHARKDKIHEALALLNDAARDKQEEVYELLGSKYEHLKDLVTDFAGNGQELAGQARKQILKGLHYEEKKIKEAAAEWDKKIHKNPWVFLGSVAAGSLVLGALLGRRK